MPVEFRSIAYIYQHDIVFDQCWSCKNAWKIHIPTCHMLVSINILHVSYFLNWKPGSGMFQALCERDGNVTGCIRWHDMIMSILVTV